MIKWHRSVDGYVRSHCGRWKINPLYCGCINPQWFELYMDGAKVGGSWFETQRAAKEEADKLLREE